MCNRLGLKYVLALVQEGLQSKSNGSAHYKDEHPNINVVKIAHFEIILYSFTDIENQKGVSYTVNKLYSTKLIQQFEI